MSEFDKITMKESRGFVEFQSKNEYVDAMVEDLSDWLNYLYNLHGDDQLTPENFFKNLNNGVILCKHAHLVQSQAEEFMRSSSAKTRELPMKIGNQTLRVPLQPPTYTIVDFTKNIFRFHARDNVSNFISWCRGFNIPASLTFETDDLVALKNARNVVVALLEVARIGTLFGMEVPDIIQLDQEIDNEINQCSGGTDGDISLPAIGNRCSSKDSETMTDGNYAGAEIGVIKTNCNHEANVNCNQKNNSSIDFDDRRKVLAKHTSFGFKGRRGSLNIPMNHSDEPDAPQTSYSTKCDLEHHVIRKTNSVSLDNNEGCDTLRFDNSDSESNFSQNSHSKFVIPKYKMNKPIGRVKIYDGFDQSNYVKVKKCREKVDLRSLDERVRDILSQCQCEELFLMKRIGEGRYQWGDKKIMIFIRILRSHVMVRVGGGWNTLGDFLYKHDPCRREKFDNYKFFLPSNHKKTFAEEKSILQPTSSQTFPKSPFHSPQVSRMISKRGSFNIGDTRSIRILKEEIDETDDVINKENVIEPGTETDDFTKSRDDTLKTKTTEAVLRNDNIPVRSERSSSMSLIGYPKSLLATFQKKTIKKSNSSDTTVVAGKIDCKKKSSRIPRLKP